MLPPMSKKIRPDRTVKLRAYAIISQAVSSGIAYGYRRAHKHTDKPSEDHVLEQIENAVLGELCELIDFGD